MRPLNLRIRQRAADHSLWHILVLCSTLLCIALITPRETLATADRIPAESATATPPLGVGLTAAAGSVPNQRYALQAIQLAKLTATDGLAGAYLGSVIAADGDTVVAGASGAKAAYIFSRDQAAPDQWRQAAKLTASDDPDKYSWFFGYSVAINGDIAVVGTVGEPSNQLAQHGAAYVFARNQGGAGQWGMVARLEAHDPIAYGVFGVSVAVDGDTIVVGSSGAQTNGWRSGAAYVFARNQGGAGQWGEVAKLIADDPAAYDDFGKSVAVYQDTIVVGAPQGIDYVTDPGAIYVFARDAGGARQWGQVARRAASDSSLADTFGSAVALNQDTLVVGAQQAGAAYVYARDAGGTWQWDAARKLTASDAPGSGAFGTSVATTGGEVLIGAPDFEVNPNNRRGATFVYARDAGGANQWGETMRLTRPDTASSYSFGSAVAMTGDTLLVGTPNDGGEYYDIGAVYTYRLYARPHAVDDQASTNEDTPVAIDVLHNDSTPADTGALNPASVTVLAAPAHGSSTVDAFSGVVSYTPQPNFNGVDGFVYGVSNTIGTSQSATVTVTVRAVNDAPLFSSVARTAATAHSPYRYSIAATDADAGDSLTISAPTKPGWLTFTSSGAGAATLSGDPGDADVGDYTVRLRAEDGGGLSATQSFTITVAANSAPRFTSIPPTVVREGNRYFYSISAADSDPGQALAISAPLMPSWLAFLDRGNGTAVLSGTASYADVGDHAVQLRAVDVGGQAATQVFTITVEPDRPPAPSELRVVPFAADQLRLIWRDNSQTELGFSIERRASDSSWAEIGTVAANVSSYTDTALACGASYEYRVRALNEHWASEPSNAASGTPSLLQLRSFAYDGAARPIYEDSYTTASIVVNAGGTIADVDVQADIEHIYDGDLLLALTAPSGQQIILASHAGSFGHNYSGTIFDDQATTSISSGRAPFTGSYQPSGQLSSFYLQPIAGRWTLRVENYAGPFRGAIKQFALKMRVPVGCTQEPPANPTPTASPSPMPTASPTPTASPSPMPTDAPAGSPNSFVRVSAGREHACALQPDGTLGCWGWNNDDQTTVPPGAYRDVDGGQSYTCAVRTSGALACWGRSISGDISPPAGTFTQVSAGEYYACAIRSDRSVACWGYNSVGGPVPPAGTFSKVSVGDSHSCGLRTDQTLACWGGDNNGQSQAPQGSFTDISAGGTHSCAVRADATLACWGSNSDGQVLAPPGTFTQVAAGESHTCALRTDATVTCWGANVVDQIRPPPGTFSQINAEYDKTCGLRTDNPRSLICWGAPTLTLAPASLADGVVGASYRQQLSADQGAQPYTFQVAGGALPLGITLAADGALSGTPSDVGPFNFIVRATDNNGLSDIRPYTISIHPVPGTATPVPAPVDVPPSEPPSALPETLSSGGLFSCGIRPNGAPACWGWNNFNVVLPPTGTYTQISAGMDLACAVRTDARLACWGNNEDRNGQYAGQDRPPPGMFTQVSAGQEHACAVRTDGTLACWGSAAFGRIAPPSGVFRQVSVGLDHSCAIQADGALACWGSNSYGQATPPPGVFTQISSRYYSSCGVRADGRISCWGSNELGLATPPDGTFTQVSLGISFACGRRSDSTLACWGANGYLQSEPPTGGFAQVAAGADHVCALKLDGLVVCWGRHGIYADIPPAGTFVADPAALPAPVAARVISVEIPGHVGGGILDEGEILADSISSITVTFSLDMPYLRPFALMLLSEGATPGFQTSSCARLDAGDLRVENHSLANQATTRSLAVSFATPANARLPNGSYRLIVCDTSSGGYPLLDGDADGVSGGDFVRNFTIGGTMPITPPATPQPTPIASPQLALDAQAGKPGSAFGITGSGYPADAQLIVTINGVRVGDLRTDHAGGFKLILDTLPEAGLGAYVVAVSPAQATNGAAVSTSQLATVTYTLDPAALLRSITPDGGTTRISVPASIRPLGGSRTYLPFVGS